MNEQELQRLLELRQKEQLEDAEQTELDGLERKLKGSDTPEPSGGDGQGKGARQNDDGGYSAEDLKKIMREVMGESGSAKQGDEPELNPGKGQGDARAKGGDPAYDHGRRAVRYFNAIASGQDSQHEAANRINELENEFKQNVSKQRLQDEEREAEEIIRNSNLSGFKQSMARHAVGLQTRLMTTSTTDTPSAGYLLPKPFLAEVFVLVERYGVARRQFRGVPMTSNSLDLKNLSTKVVAAWTDEGNNITADDLAFTEGALNAKKLAGYTNWTSELQEDQAIALLPVVQESFAESMAEKEDDAAFNGDGSATYGGFTGLLNLSGATTETMATGNTAGTNLTEDNIRNAKANISEAARMGGVWYMHYSTLDYVSTLENGAGNRIFPNAFSAGQPSTILGQPVVTVQKMPAIDNVSADSPFIVYGNPQRALFGTRRGMTADLSREAIVQDGSGNIIFNAFQGDGAILRLTQRVGIKVPSAFESSFAVIKTAAT